MSPALGIQEKAGVFLATFSGLALETLPFLLIGTLLASVMAVLLPLGTLKRLFPSRPLPSILFGLVLGAFLPVCECATIPLARRLRDEGIPESTALAFLLAAPIVNPLSIISTVVAFRGTGLPMAPLRLAAGLGTAFLMALVLEISTQWRRASPVAASLGARGLGVALPLGRSGARRAAIEAGREKRGLVQTLGLVGRTCADDFFDSSRYLILGLLVAAALRAFVGEGALKEGLATDPGALFSGSVAAYVLSLCSTADAFVARSLFFPESSLGALAFLVLGPMLDIKNTILLSGVVGVKRIGPLLAILLPLSAAVCYVFYAFWAAL